MGGRGEHGTQASNTDIQVILTNERQKTACLITGYEEIGGIPRLHLYLNIWKKQNRALLSWQAVNSLLYFTDYRWRKVPLSKLEKDIDSVQSLKSMLDKDINMKFVICYVCSLRNASGILHDFHLNGWRSQKSYNWREKKSTVLHCHHVTNYNIHIKQVHYIGILWSRADTTYPSKDINPPIYGWQDKDEHFISLSDNENSLP